MQTAHPQATAAPRCGTLGTPSLEPPRTMPRPCAARLLACWLALSAGGAAAAPDQGARPEAAATSSALRVFQPSACRAGKFSGPITRIMWDTLTRLTDVSVSLYAGDGWELYMPCSHGATQGPDGERVSG
jgi:hypothetical protein